MAKLFLSYKHSLHNKSLAELMHSYLKTVKGHDVFLDQMEIHGGSIWEQTIYNALSESDVLLVMVTDDILTSYWVRREIDFARGNRTQILPVVVDDKLLAKDEKGDLPVVKILSELALSHIHYVKAFESIGTPDIRYAEVEKSIFKLAAETRIEQQKRIEILQETWKELDDKNLELQPPDPNSSVQKYTLQNGSRTTTIHLAVGDIAEMRGIDVIVNSENIYMQMQRVFASDSVSKMIRFKGAERKGDLIIDDTIQRELNNYVFGKDGYGVPVEIGSVIVTSAGHSLSELSKAGIKYIFHVGVVDAHHKKGQQKLTDQSVPRICTLKCFEELEKLQQNPSESIKSIIFPIFGSGNAGLDLGVAAEIMIKAIRDYLKEHPRTKLKNIHINAYRRVDVRIVEGLLDKYFQRK